MRGMRSARAGAMRSARALVLAGLVLALSAGGHTVGGGSVTSAAALVLFTLMAPLAWWLARWRGTFGRALGVLAAGQVAVHTLLGLMEPATSGAAVANASHHSLPPALAPLPHAAHVGASLTPQMLLAHLGVSLLAAWLIARAEDALWGALLRLLPQLARPRLPQLAWHTDHRLPSPAATTTLYLARPGRAPPVGAAVAC